MRRAVFFAVVGGILALVFWRGCGRQRDIAPVATTARPAITLKEDDAAQIVFDSSKREMHYAIRKLDGAIVQKTVKSLRKARVNVKKTGEIYITARSWGFCLEPGLTLVIHGGPRPGGDLQFFYAGNWGVATGLFYHDSLRVYLAGTYSLARLRLANVGVWAGADLRSEVILGLRVRLN